MIIAYQFVSKKTHAYIVIMLGILYHGYFSLPAFIKDKDEYNINIYHFSKLNTMAVHSLDMTSYYVTLCVGGSNGNSVLQM